MKNRLITLKNTVPEEVDHVLVRPEVCVVDEVVAEEEVVIELGVDEGALVAVGAEHDGNRGVVAILQHVGRVVVLL